MNNFKLSRRNILATSAAATLASMIGANSAAALPFGRPAENNSAAQQADIIFVDSSAAQLAGIRRVVIANYVVAFQIEAKDFREATRYNRAETAASLAWDNPDVAMMQQITDAGYAKLKAEFIAKGIEVLDTSVLAGQPMYQTLQRQTGFGSPAYWGNGDGRAVLVV